MVLQLLLTLQIEELCNLTCTMCNQHDSCGLHMDCHTVCNAVAVMLEDLIRSVKLQGCPGTGGDMQLVADMANWATAF